MLTLWMTATEWRSSCQAEQHAIWLHAVSADHEMASPRSLSASRGGVVVYVDSVDADFEKARAAGATIDSEPTNLDYCQREYGAV